MVDITKAILEVDQKYEELAKEAAGPFTKERGWGEVAGEHEELFQTLVRIDG